jgi:ketosteroid isomerase-like protein
MKGQSRMNLANTITGLEHQAGDRQEKGVVRYDEWPVVTTPQQILQAALDALRKGNVSEVLARFADDFTFSDHTLSLEFTDKPGLGKFFEKSRELFPSASREIVSVFEEGDQAVAQWKLSATQIVRNDSIIYRFPIFLFGATIVRVEGGKIVQWSDYHDQSSARRMSLPAFFTEGI